MVGKNDGICSAAEIPGCDLTEIQSDTWKQLSSSRGFNYVPTHTDPLAHNRYHTGLQVEGQGDASS